MNCSTKYRVLCGGSWNNNAYYLRYALRLNYDPDGRGGSMGFRLVRVRSMHVTKYRVLRGGSWSSGARYLRSASRSGGAPGKRNGGVGFRLVRTESRHSLLLSNTNRQTGEANVEAIKMIKKIRFELTKLEKMLKG